MLSGSEHLLEVSIKIRYNLINETTCLIYLKIIKFLCVHYINLKSKGLEFALERSNLVKWKVDGFFYEIHNYC